MKPLRIMIADDHEEMLRVLIRRLSKNFEIISAVTNGKYLVDGAMALKPDVIVSDAMMPVLTGPEAFAELNARGFRIPFVFVSSETQGLGIGPWSVVDKTDVFSEIKTAVEAAAEGKIYISRSASLDIPALSTTGNKR